MAAGGDFCRREAVNMVDVGFLYSVLIGLRYFTQRLLQRGRWRMGGGRRASGCGFVVRRRAREESQMVLMEKACRAAKRNKVR